MLTELDVVTTYIDPLSDTDLLTFHLGTTAYLDKIQVHNIDGIGPVKATVNTTQYGSIDGSYFTGSSLPERNIVITVGYNPDWGDGGTIEELRQVLYQYFMPKQVVGLTFRSTHMPDVDIAGIVESVDPNIFSQDPEVQVSIICPDPAFYGTELVTVDLVALVIGAEEELVDTIGYTGNVPTPIKVEVTKGSAIDYTGEILIENINGSFHVNSSINSTHSLEFDSTDGSRKIDDVTSSSRTSLIPQVDDSDTWVKLQSGKNYFSVRTTTGGQAVQVSYLPQFGGL